MVVVMEEEVVVLVVVVGSERVRSMAAGRPKKKGKGILFFFPVVNVLDYDIRSCLVAHPQIFFHRLC